MLQTVLGDDRNLHIGVGRGLARREYRSLGIDMDESRSRFDEVLRILKMALTNERFSFDGEHFHIPPTSIRPYPKDGQALVDRLYGAWGSPPSIRVVAEAGIKPFLNPQKPLGDYDKDLIEFRKIREEEQGLPPVPPTIVLFGYCAETQEQAIADATRYSGEYHQSALDALRVRRRPPRQAEDLPALRAAGEHQGQADGAAGAVLRRPDRGHS